MTSVFLPHRFKPREYQLDVFKAFFLEKKKRFINVWHRRAGKDKTWLNILIAASQLRVGTYLYTFPLLKEARDVVWEGIDKDGMKFIDHIPKSLIAGRPNNTRMTINFKNGSVLKLGGSDRYNSFMGTNPIGIIQSEFAIQNPLAWEHLKEILRENGGWASFIFTPRGMNHAAKLYNTVKDNEDWYCNLLTVDDTRRNTGEPVFSKEDIEKERREGTSEQVIQQEYYCSFTSATVGAYFAPQLRKMAEQKRIKSFIIKTNSLVYSFWDLGIGDKTAIWLMQYIDNTPHMIMYYENYGVELQHYINFLHDVRSKYGFIYGVHYLPHDGINKSLQTGKTLIGFANSLGLSPTRRVQRCKKKIDAIEAARMALDSTVIHEENCAQGLACLREYHAEFNNKIEEYNERPVHNWASHGADAFMTYAQSGINNKNNAEGQIFYNALNINI